jgi:hypothetical protein
VTAAAAELSQYPTLQFYAKLITAPGGDELRLFPQSQQMRFGFFPAFRFRRRY